MSRAPPMSRCLALLHAFDKNHPDPEAAVDTAAGQLEAAINARSFADLNEGQFAALIDFVIWKGIDIFIGDPMFAWIENGNLTLPPVELAAQYDIRGRAERDMWNLGNSE